MPEVTTDVDAAVRVLRAGGLVGLPTETVYGLAAHARNPEAVRRVFAVKGRPPTHPLIVHLPDASHVGRWAAEIPAALASLADALWPGPLTVVMRAAAEVPAEVTGGRDTVAVRVPAHPLALEVLRRLDDGLAAPSANRFGEVSPTTAAHVVADLGDDVDLVLDGGPCLVGVESTIIDLSGETPEVLRTGAVTVEELSSLLGTGVTLWSGEGEARAPGMLASHYAPHATVYLLDDAAASTEIATGLPGEGSIAVLAGTTTELDQVRSGLAGLAHRLVDLEPVGGPEGFAHDLYDRLRQADRLKCTAVVVVAPPPQGVGAAVRDRLARAASGN